MRFQWLCFAWVLCSMSSLQACVPAGWNIESLRALKSREFEGLGSKQLQVLARELVDCLGDADPELRDGLAYTGLAHWMRAENLEVATLRALLQRLLPRLRSNDTAGFEAPFAALVLSEVARTDRLKPWLKKAQRQHLVRAAASYIAGVSDYRGFEDGAGWRHGVAHGADLALQLIANPATSREEIDLLVDALLRQVSPAHAHSYRFGEPERLARPLLFAAGRGLHSSEDLERWMHRLTDPTPLASWSDAYNSELGLARLHNTKSFLLSAYAGATLSSDSKLQVLAPLLAAALKRMP